MEDKYISKKEIDEDFDLFIDTVPQNQKAFVYVFKSRIDMISAADVKPVIHAHWIKRTPSDPVDYFDYECSHCHCWHISDSDFCPECGAIMDEEVE